VDVLGQHLPGLHAVVPGDRQEMDRLNREAFEECFQIVKLAWTEDVFSFDGRFWKIPPPGIPWATQLAARYGAGAPDGVLRQVGVVPKPVQRPHPPIYQPVADSEATIAWCGRQGVTAVLPPPRPEVEDRFLRVYAEASGRPLGHGIGIRRDVVIADTEEEERRLFLEGPGFYWDEWLRPFGFGRTMVDPATGRAPDMIDEGYALVGTVDSVTRALERLPRRVPLEVLVVAVWNGLIPHAANLRSLEALRQRGAAPGRRPGAATGPGLNGGRARGAEDLSARRRMNVAPEAVTRRGRVGAGP
jgi:alkanesulfonate monooxygenase SsuD/methylene tetrahydromethanopterin reductase-like flavin-dependent oxidoreductase (luciferase family)